eukprot:6043457-Karenia_brevis.AAC.1
MTRNLANDILHARRAQESPGLQFLAMACFLQLLMGRHFMIENSGASEIFVKSPLHVLERLGLLVHKLDQCMYGAMMEGEPIKKSSKLFQMFVRQG